MQCHSHHILILVSDIPIEKKREMRFATVTLPQSKFSYDDSQCITFDKGNKALGFWRKRGQLCLNSKSQYGNRKM
jgi:hypothetical protein